LAGAGKIPYSGLRSQLIGYPVLVFRCRCGCGPEPEPGAEYPNQRPDGRDLEPENVSPVSGFPL